MKQAIAFILVLIAATAGLAAKMETTDSLAFSNPVIKKYGGIVAMPEAAQQPKENSKVLLDITSDEQSGRIVKGFDRAALILNQYAQAEAGMEKGFKMAIILHGRATKMALKNESFAKHSEPYARSYWASNNPNIEIIQQLAKEGVEIYVCAQAMAHRGYERDEVIQEVITAVSAATVNINKQMEGYAYIPFH